MDVVKEEPFTTMFKKKGWSHPLLEYTGIRICVKKRNGPKKNNRETV